MLDFLHGLNSRGQNARLYGLRDEKNRGATIQWQLEVHGHFASRLLPRIEFRHGEKITGKELAMAYHGVSWNIAGPIYKEYRRAILIERASLEAIAKHSYLLRGERKRRKAEIFRRRLESSFELFTKNLTMKEVAETLHCSIRTAYRRREAFKEALTKTGTYRIRVHP